MNTSNSYYPGILPKKIRGTGSIVWGVRFGLNEESIEKNIWKDR